MSKKFIAAVLTTLALVVAPVAAGPALAHKGGDPKPGSVAKSKVYAAAKPVTVGKATVVVVKVAGKTGKAAASSTKASALRKSGGKHGFVPASGTVRVKVAGATFTGTLNAKGKAKVAIPAGLAAGKYKVKVRYLGNGTFPAKSAKTWLVVKKAKAKVAVTASAAPGAQPSATVVVSSKKATPKGKVTVWVRYGEYRAKAKSTLVDGQVEVTLPEALPALAAAARAHGSKGKAAKVKFTVRYHGSKTFKAKTVTTWVKLATPTS